MERLYQVALTSVLFAVTLAACRKEPDEKKQGRKVRSQPAREARPMRIPQCSEQDDFLTKEEKIGLLRLARRSVERSVRGLGLEESELLRGLQLTPELKKPYGAFVTLKKHGRLRGCIGYLQPIEPLYRAVIHNARNAALRDRRFRPVQPEELPELEIEVSVLSVPVEVDSYEKIRIGCHGIILEKQGRRATYLPHVAPEQGWGIEETLSHLSVKAGLDPNAWRRGTRFWVYTALVFDEKEFGLGPGRPAGREAGR